MSPLKLILLCFGLFAIGSIVVGLIVVWLLKGKAIKRDYEIAARFYKNSRPAAEWLNNDFGKIPSREEVEQIRDIETEEKL
jgi:hypothetical protein